MVFGSENIQKNMFYERKAVVERWTRRRFLCSFIIIYYFCSAKNGISLNRKWHVRHYQHSRHHTWFRNFPMHRSLPPYRHQEWIPLWCEVLACVLRFGHCRMHRLAVCGEHLHFGNAGRLQFLVLLVDSGTLPATWKGAKRMVPEEER